MSLVPCFQAGIFSHVPGMSTLLPWYDQYITLVTLLLLTREYKFQFGISYGNWWAFLVCVIYVFIYDTIIYFQQKMFKHNKYGAHKLQCWLQLPVFGGNTNCYGKLLPINLSVNNIFCKMFYLLTLLCYMPLWQLCLHLTWLSVIIHFPILSIVMLHSYQINQLIKDDYSWHIHISNRSI